jgi:hypothetical protein
MLITRMVLSAGVLLGSSIGVIGAPSVRADPSAPAEIKFLNDVRSNMQRYGDTRVEGMSDANLVGEGWWACHELAIGASPQHQGIDPLIAHYASVDLCPNGCPEGCRHRQPMG